LWIRQHFNADLDPDSKNNADPDPFFLPDTSAEEANKLKYSGTAHKSQRCILEKHFIGTAKHSISSVKLFAGLAGPFFFSF
jgi:hypothetical protein